MVQQALEAWKLQARQAWLRVLNVAIVLQKEWENKCMLSVQSLRQNILGQHSSAYKYKNTMMTSASFD